MKRKKQRGVVIVFEDRPLLRVVSTDLTVTDYELRGEQLMLLAEQALKAERQRRAKFKLD